MSVTRNRQTQRRMIVTVIIMICVVSRVQYYKLNL